MGAQLVAQIAYENEAAVLSFDYQDVIDSLINQIAELNVEDDFMLLKWFEEI